MVGLILICSDGFGDSHFGFPEMSFQENTVSENLMIASVIIASDFSFDLFDNSDDDKENTPVFDEFKESEPVMSEDYDKMEAKRV